MLITPSSFKSDPRVMCGLLASMSLKLIDGDPRTSESDLVAESLLRILELYKYDAFRNYNSSGILNRMSRTEREFEDQPNSNDAIAKGLQKVHKAMDPRSSRVDFAERISAAVRACFRIENVDQNRMEGLRQLLQEFLRLFVRALANA